MLRAASPAAPRFEKNSDSEADGDDQERPPAV